MKSLGKMYLHSNMVSLLEEDQSDNNNLVFCIDLFRMLVLQTCLHLHFNDLVLEVHS